MEFVKNLSASEAKYKHLEFCVCGELHALLVIVKVMTLKLDSLIPFVLIVFQTQLVA